MSKFYIYNLSFISYGIESKYNYDLIEFQYAYFPYILITIYSFILFYFYIMILLNSWYNSEYFSVSYDIYELFISRSVFSSFNISTVS